MIKDIFRGDAGDNNLVSDSPNSEVSAITVLYPTNGVYSIQPQCALNRELNVAGAYTKQGSEVITYTISSQRPKAANARWIIERMQNDWYKIRAAHSLLALNVEGSNLTTVQYSGKYQLFRFIDCYDGYCIIQPNAYQDYAVAVMNGSDANHTNVIICPYHGGSSQKWKLVRL